MPSQEVPAKSAPLTSLTEVDAAWQRIKASFPAEGARLERLNGVDNGLSSRMARKRRLITSMMHPAITVPRLLRVFISHTRGEALAEKEDEDEEDRMVPTWTLRIEGGVVDGNQLSPYYRFSQFFERITINIDKRSSKGTSGQITDNEWNRPDQALTFDQEVDGFECSNPGEKECHVKVALQQRFEPGHERYRLSAELSRLLKLPREAKASTLQTAVLDLVRSRELFALPAPVPAELVASTSVTAYILCDPDLQKLVGLQRVHLAAIIPRLTQQGHLSLPEPLTIDYTISAAGSVDPRGPKVVDVRVEARSDLQMRCSEAVGGKKADKERADRHDKAMALDRQAQYLFRTIAARTRRLERYKRLAETPVEELQRQVQEGESQRELLAECLGDAAGLSGLLSQLQHTADAAAGVGIQHGPDKWGAGSLRWIADSTQAYLTGQR